ncbi:MAG TPA: amidohydrolase family protein [Verrucomicrobiae bacterium]|nr:amidohydrolase family protein [Verrucomicrobiae bacterium]
MILRARIVLPLTQPPISDGAVFLSGERIQRVGRWRDLRAESSESSVDLGEVMLMPGLVNAHCHLDYTHMAGQFPPPRHFIDWLKLITTTKAQWTAAEYRASWLSGAEMLVRTGTTTVADIEAVPQLLPQIWDSTPLRILSFLEMIGITSRRPPDRVLQEALDKIQTLPHQRCLGGLSPHAPYSTVPALLEQSAEVARRRGWLLCTHVAESKPEFLMFTKARGDMFEWLQRSGREMSDCGLGSPVKHLERCGVLRRNLLATHVNYLARGDAALLARRKVSVVHCPRSHAYFDHESFPLRRLYRAGVNVCLGTDSLASVIKTRRQDLELDMLAEMRVLADRQSWLSPKTILRMATVAGALALARGGVIGQLSPGALADIVALPGPDTPKRAAEAVLEHRGRVAASMIEGAWVIPPA